LIRYEASRFVPPQAGRPDRHDGQRDKRMNERTNAYCPSVRSLVRLLDGTYSSKQNAVQSAQYSTKFSIGLHLSTLIW